MNAKEYLSQAYHIDQRITCKTEQIRSLKELVRKVNSVISDSPKDNYDKQINEILNTYDIKMNEILEDIKYLDNEIEKIKLLNEKGSDENE